MWLTKLASNFAWCLTISPHIWLFFLSLEYLVTHWTQGSHNAFVKIQFTLPFLINKLKKWKATHKLFKTCDVHTRNQINKRRTTHSTRNQIVGLYVLWHILKCSSFEEEKCEKAKIRISQNTVFKYSNKEQNYGHTGSRLMQNQFKGNCFRQR